MPRIYACIRKLYAWSEKKRKKRNAGGKTGAIRKIELIFLPIDASLFQKEREREKGEKGRA